jgi:hypothetical protein
MGKTIRAWFMELPEPYRSQALENADVPDNITLRLSDALLRGFEWGSTPQGDTYWDSLFQKIEKGDLSVGLEQLVREYFEAKEDVEVAEKALREAVGL